METYPGVDQGAPNPRGPLRITGKRTTQRLNLPFQKSGESIPWDRRDKHIPRGRSRSPHTSVVPLVLLESVPHKDSICPSRKLVNRFRVIKERDTSPGVVLVGPTPSWFHWHCWKIYHTKAQSARQLCQGRLEDAEICRIPSPPHSVGYSRSLSPYFRTLETFRLDYDCEIEYEYDFRISNQWCFQSSRSSCWF